MLLLSSTTSTFDLVAESGQFGDHFVTMLALNLNFSVFNGAPGAARLLDLLCQRGQVGFAPRYASNHGHGFPAALLAVTHHAHNPIAFARGLATLAAATLFVGQAADGTGADPPALC